MALVVKNLPANAGNIKRDGFHTWVGKMPWRRAWSFTPVFFAWRIPWTEEPGRLQSIGSHRVGHDWSDLACMHVCRVLLRIKWDNLNNVLLNIKITYIISIRCINSFSKHASTVCQKLYYAWDVTQHEINRQYPTYHEADQTPIRRSNRDVKEAVVRLDFRAWVYMKGIHLQVISI